MLGQLSVKAAVTVKDTVQKKIDDERKKQSSPKDIKSVHEDEEVIDKAKFVEDANDTTQDITDDTIDETLIKKDARPEHYVSDDETLSCDGKEVVMV